MELLAKLSKEDTKALIEKGLEQVDILPVDMKRFRITFVAIAPRGVNLTLSPRGEENNHNTQGRAA